MNQLLLILSLLMVAQGLGSLRTGRRNARYAKTYAPTSHVGAGTGRFVRVFCPVRGAAADLETNLGSLLEQDYGPYRVSFILEDPDDPAHAVVARLAAADRADVVYAGKADGCGQKVHNLTVGVERTGGGADIFAFADADARFPPEWLRDLVGPLDRGPESTTDGDDRGIGATTGYRWYVAPGSRQEVPEGASYWASSFRSAWNASVAGFLGPAASNFAWGGSMAIRSEVFERIGVRSFWKGSVSDDFALTAAVRGAGLRVRFVPTCLVVSAGGCSWRELWEFSVRQMRITRVYAPDIWRVAMGSYTLYAGTLTALTLSLGSGAGPAIFWMLGVGLAAWRADYRLVTARLVLGLPSLRTRRWFYRLASPLVAFLFFGNVLASLGSREIVWKGIRYRMKSPNETVIVERA